LARHHDRERTDPAQGFKEEHVVAQDVGVQGADASLPGPGEECGHQPGSDPPTLPVIFHHDAKVGGAGAIWRQRRHADATGTAPGQVCLVVRVIPE
jgi:hypothetical protein